MSLEPGTLLKSYEILRKIGSGGMGEVYRAKDRNLGRHVALKTLHPKYASDPTRIRRFEQEARSASALNHPGIVTIHEIGQHDSILFIVMEFIEGQTLRSMISSSPLSIEKILEVAIQIARALAKAHEAGIVHRDLKPENVMISDDGFVKILDFGLAKLSRASEEEDSQIVTRTEALTKNGIIMGTVAYMSPEQASGRTLDYRSDQFSFGSLLYQMATGKLPFHRETTPQTLAAIIEDEPHPVVTLNPDIPVHLSLIVQRCLNKNPVDRYDSTGDLARDLKAVGHNRLIQVERDARIESLAVLPLANMSKDPEQEYFADGMTEALITDLAKIGSIKVISRTSAMRYKGTNKFLPQIARELNVQAVLEGSVLRAEGRVRITAQLIEAATDQHLWAESYERDLRDILSLQREVARTIAHEIQVRLTPQEENLLISGKEVHPEAHEAYLQGRYHLNKWTAGGFQKAIEYFETSLQLDPGFAMAYAGLAEVFMMQAYLGYEAPRQVLLNSQKAVIKALDLDPTLAEAHLHQGYVKIFLNGSLDEGESGFKRAIELNPNYADAYARYALFHTALMRYPEAMRLIARALELDPFSVTVQMAKGMILAHARRYDEAVVQFHEILKIDPNLSHAHFLLATIFKRKGRNDEAFQSLKKSFEMNEAAFLARRMQKAYERSGLDQALITLARWLTRAYYFVRILKYVPFVRNIYIPPIMIAMIYAKAGDTHRPFRWLEKAYRERDPQIYTLHAPIWDLIREEPEFQSLVARVFKEKDSNVV